MDLGLPYAKMKHTSHRLLGIYAWLCDDDENPGVLVDGCKLFDVDTIIVSRALCELNRHRLQLAPLECIAYFPYTSVEATIATGHFRNDLTLPEREEVVRCSVRNNEMFNVVLRFEMQDAIEGGDVGKPSRLIAKWLKSKMIDCCVWTTALAPKFVYVAIADDAFLVVQAVSAIQSHLLK